MALLLLQIIFWAIGSLASLLSFVVFRGAALLIVALIQLFKVPRQASTDVIEFIGGIVRSALEYVLELVMDAAVWLVSSSFDALASAASGSVQLTASAAGEMLEKTKSGLEMLSEVFPQVVEGASEMVVNVAESLWNSYKDAVGYILENA